MKRWTLWMISIVFLINCAANVPHFYNRDGWSYHQTKKSFQNVLVLSDQSMIEEKVEPVIPKNKQVKGKKAEVKVRVDKDGKVEAVIIQKGIPEQSLELVTAARQSRYKIYRTPQGKARHYVLIVEYRF